MVVATSAELIEDIKKAPEDILSRNEMNREVCIVNRLDPNSTATTAHSDVLHPPHVKQ